jgi:hypothetical protein
MQQLMNQRSSGGIVATHVRPKSLDRSWVTRNYSSQTTRVGTNHVFNVSCRYFRLRNFTDSSQTSAQMLTHFTESRRRWSCVWLHAVLRDVH